MSDGQFLIQKAHIQENKSYSEIIVSSPKLRAALLFFVQKFSGQLNTHTLCKHIYYADGHFFQKYGKQITEFPYIHTESSPQPLFFSSVMHYLIQEKQLQIIPKIVTTKEKKKIVQQLKGVALNIAHLPEDAFSIFTVQERKVLNSIASVLKGNLLFETRYFPNLYQNYAQAELYAEIPFMEFKDGRRPHLSWKAWAYKIFKLMWE